MNTYKHSGKKYIQTWSEIPWPLIMVPHEEGHDAPAVSGGPSAKLNKP